MKISLHWLNQYLDRPTDADEVDRIMTEVGFPIDGRDNVGDDVMLDVEVTSNRPDCLSHVGVARELAAATDRKLKAPVIELPPGSAPEVNALTSVDNQATDLCPLYTARMIRGVRIGPSPDWLVHHLQTIGLRPVNNVVDITNFVLHELGQPLHAFDSDKLDGGRIVVRRAAGGERFIAIDGSRHELRDSMLVIADASKPVAIAGVMGGLDSEVGDDTVNILLESARFDPLSIRSTSRSLKLASDSSYRFERGVDPAGVDRASRRAAQLIVELAGGELAGGVIEAGDATIPEPIVQMRPERCNQLLGLELPVELMVKLLGALELSPLYEQGLITCTIPAHRLDLHREVDLIEEITRLHGFDHIPVEQKMHVTTRPPQTMIEARRRIISTLAAHGFCQTITFSFLPDAHAKAFAGDLELVKVDEDKKKAEAALRTSVLPSLLACRKGNQDAGNQDVKLFEIAQTFGRRDGRFVESRHLALLVDAPEASIAMRTLRGSLEELFDLMGCGDLKFVAAEKVPTWLSAAADILDASGAVIGTYGPAAPAICKQFDLQTPVVIAEIDYPTLVAQYPPRPQVKALPRFPAIDRDLSIVVDETTPWTAIDAAVNAARPALMERVEFITVYRGKPIEKGRKSVTFRMRFRDPQRTLEHDEVSGQVDSVIDELTKSVRAELRTT